MIQNEIKRNNDSDVKEMDVQFAKYLSDEQAIKLEKQALEQQLRQKRDQMAC